MKAASGCLSLTVTFRPSAVMLFTFAYQAPQKEPSFGSMLRLRLATASAPVIGLPSENFTPSRSV